MLALLMALALAACAPPEQKETKTTTGEIQAEPAQGGQTADAEGDKAVAAIVAGEPIYLSEVDERVKGLEDKFRELNPQLRFPEDKKNKLRRDFLQRMIREKVLLMEADRRKITVDEQEVQNRIDQLKLLFGNSPEAQQRFLDGIKDMNRFRAEVTNQARISKLMDQEIKAKIQITEDELRSFFEANPERFADQESVKLRQILIRYKTEDASQPPSEEVKEEARKRAQEILARLEAGEDFATVAQEVSEDPATSSRGGEMGTYTKGRLPRELEDVAFGLEPGQISEPVETRFGLHILKVDEHKQAYQPTFEEVRDRVESALRSQKYRELSEKFVQELKEKANIQIKI
jgi:parvulin-like peptidyl-prolyl isomerase